MTESIVDALASLLVELEHNCSLYEPRQFPQPVAALDDLDGCLSRGQADATPVLQRARAVCAQLESANARLYEAIRRDIQHHAGADRLLELLPEEKGTANRADRQGYDYLDELVSGVLQFAEPLAEPVPLESEMVAYQPTPARHIFDLIRRTALTARDSFMDLGSGLGHVALLTAICTGASCAGIELDPSYVACARKSAESLNLSNVRFVQGDVRATDFSAGTVFYLYTPFTGAILRDALDSLRRQALRREIRVCTFGPCTPIVAQEAWLTATGVVDPDRIAILHSRGW